MKVSQTLKTLTAGVVLATGLLVLLPAHTTVQASGTGLVQTPEGYWVPASSVEAKKPVAKPAVKVVAPVKKAAVAKAPEVKVSEFKTLAELKVIAKDLYNSPAHQPKNVVVKTKTDLTWTFVDYYFSTSDFSEIASGYTFYGRNIDIDTVKVKDDVYNTTLSVVNHRDAADELAWNKRMDDAEKFIVANYSLKTEYDVV
ncbi:hypothetical protein MKZ26_07960 [Sporosarcina sp. FSL K6-6792]|uniref:hypothetical protein n=1 Tax=Sporosarcina sp. FSL K6-6792 TaxID=2921559 RepID=UPI0030F858B2